MKITDYLIAHESIDWRSCLEDWAWLLPDSYTIWLVNRFGDLIIVLDDESVHLVDVGAGTITELAKSREDFIQKIDDHGNAEQWLLISLVDSARSATLAIGDHECYSYRIPPILGGDYSVANLEVCDLSVHYSILGQICKQTQGVTDGTRVHIKIKE